MGCTPWLICGTVKNNKYQTENRDHKNHHTNQSIDYVNRSIPDMRTAHLSGLTDLRGEEASFCKSLLSVAPQEQLFASQTENSSLFKTDQTRHKSRLLSAVQQTSGNS